MKSLELRIPPLLVFTVCALLVWTLGKLTPPAAVNRYIFAISVLLAITGATIAYLGVVEFRKHRTTVNPLNPSKSSEVVTTGVFRISRNPMYLGMAIVLFAFCTYFGSIWSISAVAIFIIYITTFQIIPEEQVLTQMFGRNYEEYKRRVRRWI